MSGLAEAVPKPATSFGTALLATTTAFRSLMPKNAKTLFMTVASLVYMTAVGAAGLSLRDHSPSAPE